MKKINELRDYLLENYVDRDGDLDIRGLDFGDFDGNIMLDRMKVKGDLFQNEHNVEGDLYQSWHNVEGDYYATSITVCGTITFEVPLKEITVEELEKMGYKLKEGLE